MKKNNHILIHFIMIVTAAMVVFPFLVILGSSFQSAEDLSLHGYKILPGEFSLVSYNAVLKNPTDLIRSYTVTITTSLITVVVGVLISTMCAYVMTRKSYRYRRILSMFVFFPMLINGGMVANYINIVQNLGLKDSYLVLILPLLVSTWYIILMKGFIASIPDALIESAKIDGAGEFRIFIQMIIPLSKPAIATISLFYLLGSWNEWYNSLLYIEDPHMIKLQYLLMKIQTSINFLNSAEAMQYGAVQAGQEVPTSGARMAMCIIAAGPMLVIFPFFQKYFVQGLTVGSVKG